MRTYQNLTEKDVKNLFDEISKFKFRGKILKYDEIKKKLEELRKGGMLTYQHLNIISDKKYFSCFNNYWRFPEETKEFKNELTKTNKLFASLEGRENFDTTKIEEIEREAIKILYGIFKHLELVSIILRFVNEQYYAIYSPPVAKILNPPRGSDYVSEYLNYLGYLRAWQNTLGLKKVAYVDMFLWALEEFDSLGKQQQEKIKIFFTVWAFNKNIEKRDISDFRKDLLTQLPKEKAEYFLRVEDYHTSAMWGGYYFEDVVRAKCNRAGINLLKYDEYRDGSYKVLKELVIDLAGYFGKAEGKYLEVVNLRNKAMHPRQYQFSMTEAKNMLNIAKEMANWKVR